MKEIIEELTNYFLTVQEFDKDSAQDGQVLHAYLIELTNVMARANFLMAEYNRKFREEKKLAYEKLANSRHADQRYYAPSLAKDYIDSQCSESGYVYDLAERVSRLQDDNISKYAVARISELEEVLKEAKEVLLQLDHRHNGKCYNPAETDCNCTLCKINSAIKKATE